MKRLGWLAVASITAGSGTYLAGIGLIVTAAYLISRAAEQPPILDLMLLFVAVRFFGLTRPALRYLERLASHDLIFRILKLTRGWFVGSLLPLSPAQLSAYRSGDLLSRMATDVDALQESYLKVIAPGVVALIVSAIAVTGLAFVDVRVAWIVLAALVAYGAGWSWIAYRQSRLIGERRNSVRRALASDLVAIMRATDDIRMAGYEQEALERCRRRQAHLDAMERADGRTLGLHASAATVFTMTAAWLVLVVCADAVTHGQLSPLWIAPLMLATIASFEAVEGLPATWQYAAQTRDSARRVLDIVRTPPAVVESSDPLDPGNAIPRIQISNVDFAYPDGPLVLHNVSLDIAPGEHVVIVGPTGAGKSTLLALLMRSWDPQRGSVRINGIDLRDVDLDDLRARIAVLPQHVHVFNTSLRENTRLGRRHASDDEVREALTRAGLASFVRNAEHGLDTRLGEHGIRMSAGERQRLGLARVFLTTASLVLADEPTANLDPRTERDVLRALHDWARGRTLVVVSHRPAAREFADRVYRVCGGSVCEERARSAY